MAARLVIGVDFSGSADQWKPRRSRPNVWLAFGRADAGVLEIEALSPIQQLAGDTSPFERLIGLLGESDTFIAIDAPFSVPAEYVETDAAALWRMVADLPLDGRPFARGRQLVSTLAPKLGERGAKLLRATERRWRDRRINVRSALWCGPRGGAPFAVACMTLLARHDGAVWPIRSGGRGATVAEAFPAAQLQHWGLDYVGYNGAGEKPERVRATIIQSLINRHGLLLTERHRQECLSSADALDAVICAYAAAGVASGNLADTPAAEAALEGWIAVHG